MKYKKLIIGLICGIVALALFVLFFLPERDVDTADNTPIATDFSFVIDEAADSAKQRMDTETEQNMRVAVVNQHYQFVSNNKSNGEWFSPTYNSDPVSLTLAQEALDFKFYPALLDQLRGSDWGVYSCVSSAKKPAYALRVATKLLPNYSGNLYQDQQEFLLNWRPDMLNDLQPILFPDAYYSSVTRVGDFEVDSDGVAVAPLEDEDGQELQVGYIVVGDNIIFGSDRGCILDFSNSMVELVP